MRIVILLLFFITSFSVDAQQTGSLTIYGKVKYKRTTIDEVGIEIYKDNELTQEFHNLKNGSFKMKLLLGSVYNITYKKAGYVKKSVAVVAKLDSAMRINGRYFFQLDIELFKKGDDLVDETMLPPVAKLYIKDQTTGFKFDKKYVKWVAEKFEEELED